MQPVTAISRGDCRGWRVQTQSVGASCLIIMAFLHDGVSCSQKIGRTKRALASHAHGVHRQRSNHRHVVAWIARILDRYAAIKCFSVDSADHRTRTDLLALYEEGTITSRVGEHQRDKMSR